MIYFDIFQFVIYVAAMRRTRSMMSSGLKTKGLLTKQMSWFTR